VRAATQTGGLVAIIDQINIGSGPIQIITVDRNPSGIIAAAQGTIAIGITPPGKPTGRYWFNTTGKKVWISAPRHADSHSTGGGDEIPAFVGDAGLGGQAGMVPAPAAGDAAAGKTLGAGGTWMAPGVPGAHASTHQHGGGDEVATATPAANALPKAGTGGTLAAGWLPAFVGDAGAGGTLGAVPAPAAGDAAAGKVMGAGGAWRDVADRRSATITRNGSGFVTIIAKTGRTVTITRDAGNLVTSKTDGTTTWTYTRDAGNLITAITAT